MEDDDVPLSKILKRPIERSADAAKKLKNSHHVTFCQIRSSSKYKSQIEAMGGEVKPNMSKLITHVVATRKALITTKRPSKIVKALLFGTKIVSENWLKNCVQAKEFIEETEYLLQPDHSESEESGTSGTEIDKKIISPPSSPFLKNTPRQPLNLSVDLNESKDSDKQTEVILQNQTLSETLDRANRLLEEAKQEFSQIPTLKEHWILDNINLTQELIHTGLKTKTVFIGVPGVGKSFILNLLMRLTCLSARDYESGNYISY
jgi:hypothetical protein